MTKEDPDLPYEFAKHRLDTQLSFVDALDSKLTQTLAIGSAETAIVVAVLALNSTAARAALLWLLAAAGAYVALATVAILALLPRRWGVGAKWTTLTQHYADGLDTPDVKRQLTHELVCHYDENKPKVDSKAHALLFVVLMLAVLTVALLLAAGRVAGLAWPL